MSFKNEFRHLRIPLQDIKSATDNFGENYVIGKGGFGKVYKGELLLSGVNTIVAIKRLDTELGQGAPEFWKEIMFLSRYKHENLVSLIGFCDESRESLLVYEYLPNKSFDRYLSSTELSWNQRLRICIGVAYGLQYLHDPNGGHQRVLHRDIKSSNILLDQNWKPKISDFGLSRIGPANQQFTFLFSNAVGTMGYFDPLYYETGFLSKESDVYSFGVVLFEVLCGRLCVENYDDIRRFLAKLAQKCYEEKKLDTIINSTIKEQISPLCLQIFSEVAYQCLRRDRKERPSMADIVNKLEMALQCQEDYEFVKKKKMLSRVVLDSDSDEYWETKLPPYVEALVKKFNIPHTTTKRELFSFLHKGYFFDDNNRFFWIDNHGNKCLAISAKRILDYNRIRYMSWGTSNPSWVTDHDSRFPTGAAEYHIDKGCYDCKIKASMLSLGTMYAASLLFKFNVDPNPSKVKLMRIKWKTEELSVHSVHAAHQSLDGKCYSIQMWHFISDGLNTDFNIIIEELSFYEDRDRSRLLIQGIEFQPIEMMQKDEEVGGFKSLSITDEEDIDDVEYWGKKLPDDYPRYIAMSDKLYDYTTKKELYLSLCQGFLGCNGKLWFSMCKSTGGVCSIHAITSVLSKSRSYEKLETSLSKSRFKEVLRLGTDNWYNFTYRLVSFMFSPHYSYACYLVFKFEDNHVLSDDILVFKAEYSLGDTTQGTVFVPLFPSNIPAIEPRKDIGLPDSTKSIRMPKGNTGYSLVRERNDGWCEFSLIEPFPHMENHESLEVKLLKPKFGSLEGIIVEGIEFRPVVRDGSYLVQTSNKDDLIGTHLQAINNHGENKDDDEYWEKKLPDDYQRHIEMSFEHLSYTTKKELYLLFCHGFLAHNDNGQLWFSTCKLTCGLCSILPATHVLFKDTNYMALETLSLSESRFKEVIKLRFYYSYVFTCRLESFMFSPDHDTYACYLVFKFEDDHVLSNDVPIFKADLNDCRIEVFANLDLTSVITIRTLKPEEKIGSSKSIDGGLGMFKVYTSKRERKSWVEKRNDGWMEARLTNPLLKQHLQNCKELKIKLRNGGSLNGIIVEGIEFRPVVVDGSYLVVETSIKDNLVGSHLQAIIDLEENKDGEEYWEKKLPDDYQRHIELSDEPLDYSTKRELYLLFCHGFLANYDNGQLWFSTCKLTHGLCSILSATLVLFKDSRYHKLKSLSLSESRFKEVRKLGSDPYYYLTCRLESFMFSPDHKTYACYLVFKFEDDHIIDGPIFTAYLNNCRIEVFANLDLTSVITKRVNERKSWVEKRNDGWMEARLTKLLSYRYFENLEKLTVELHKIEGGSLDGIIVEGVEFRPVVHDRSCRVQTLTKDDLIGTHLQAINDHEENKDDDEYWEKKLPDDYLHHIKMSDEPLDYSTKKELYLLFSHGFLAHNGNGQLWFSTCKLTCGLCSILPATHVLSSYKKLKTLYLSESRFKKASKLGGDNWYDFTCRLESFMFSPNHKTYACYLVFKLQDDHVQSNDGPIFKAYLNDCGIEVFANLDSTSKSIDGGLGMFEVYTDDRREGKTWVEKRNDGWMEARLTKLLSYRYLKNGKELKIEFWAPKGGNLRGIIVEGIEVRPVVVDGSQ